MSDDHYGLWPKPGTPGRYRVRCSCGASFTGHATEISDWGRMHDDSPMMKHVVSITNGGKRVDLESR